VRERSRVWKRPLTAPLCCGCCQVVRAAKLLARWGRRGALARLARRLWQSAAFLVGGEGEEDGGPRSIDGSSSGGDGGDGGARRPLPATEDVASLVAAGQATCVYRVDASLDVPPVVHSSSGSGSGTSSGSSGGPAAAPDVRAKIKAWGSPSPSSAADQPAPPPRIATDTAPAAATAALPAQLAAAMMAPPGPEGCPWALPLPTRLRLVEAALVEELLTALGV